MSNTYESVTKVSKKISNGMQIVVFSVMCLSVFVQIVLRTFFNESILALEDIAKYAFSWVVFTGMIHAFEDDGHVAVTAVISALPRKVAIMVDLLQRILVAGFLVVLIVWGFEFSVSSLKEVSPQLRMSAGIFYFAMPISGLLSLIPYIGYFLKNRDFGDVQHSSSTSM